MDTRCPISSRPGQRYERIPTWTTTTRTDFVTRVYEFPVDTGLSTPDGGSDWENWKLASKLLPSGTAVSLWSPSTGALYLWEGVTFDIDSGRLLYTQYRLLANFLTGATNTTLRLTDFDANGVPDLGRLGGRFPYGVPDQRPVRGPGPRRSRPRPRSRWRDTRDAVHSAARRSRARPSVAGPARHATRGRQRSLDGHMTQAWRGCVLLTSRLT